MNIKTKVKGFMSFNAVLLCLVALMAGYSLLQIYGSQFSALSASRKALQAQQFAQSEADLLRNTSYDELDAAAHDRQVITGVNGWMSEISLEAETTINEVPQRLATVKIYRNSTVTVPDFSLKLPLSSANGGTGNGFNTLVTITESCDWEAPVTGWYEFRIKGAGGGGSHGYAYAPIHQWTQGGNGGGEGGTTIAYEHLNKGDIVPITIGKGGNSNHDGEDTTLVIHGKNFVGGGGGAGLSGSSPGLGGTGTIPGAPGQLGDLFYHPNAAIVGGSGGGTGAGVSSPYYAGSSGILGSGGSGGGAWANGSVYAGGTGGNGVIWIKYFDPTKK